MVEEGKGEGGDEGAEEWKRGREEKEREKRIKHSHVVVNVMVVCVHAKAWLTCAPSYRCAHIVGIVGVVGKHVGREGYGSNEK